MSQFAVASSGTPACPQRQRPHAQRGRTADRLARHLVLWFAVIAALFAGTAPASAQDMSQLQAFRGITPQRWLTDVDAALAPAFPELGLRYLFRLPPQRLAIVFDIDNTALATSFSRKGRIVAVPAALRLAQQANRSGVAVHFVTARTPNELGWTATQLRSVGFPVDGIWGRDVNLGLQESKTMSRKQITGSGFTIAATVGNKWTDLRGGHTERIYKLPDYGVLG